MTQYLAFIDTTPPERKTKVVTVTSVKHDYFLGEIKWYGAWRQYAFFPGPSTIWNRDCLAEINERIAVLMAQRKAAKREGLASGVEAMRPER